MLGLSRALTGWTFGGQNQSQPGRFFRPQRNYRIPMEPWAFYHDTGAKLLLDGVTLPAGQSARDDLEDALDVIFNHPNVGPFICRAAHPAAGDEQPEPGVRLPRGRAGLRQQRRRAARRHGSGRARHPARLRGALDDRRQRGPTTATCASRWCASAVSCAPSTACRAPAAGASSTSAPTAPAARPGAARARRRCSTSSSPPTRSPARWRRRAWCRRSSRSPPRRRSSPAPTSPSSCSA